MSSPSATVKWVAIAAIVATGLIHAGEAEDAFGDATYKGVLFVANCVGALVAAVGIYRNRLSWGWVLGVIVAGSTFIGYVVSRTIGLPGLPAANETWLEPPGVASLVVEGLFVALFIAKRPRSSDRVSEPPAHAT